MKTGTQNYIEETFLRRIHFRSPNRPIEMGLISVMDDEAAITAEIKLVLIQTKSYGEPIH